MKEKKQGNDVVRKSFFVICGVVLLFAIAYAIFTFTGYGEKEHRLSTGTLVLTLDESTSSGISISDAVPVTDEVGLSFAAYTFSVQNTGTLKANYQILLVNDDDKYVADGCSDNKMDWKNIKYSFEKDSSSKIELLNKNSGVLDTGMLAPGESKNYTLRLWISDTAVNDVMGTHFHGRIQVKAIQEGHTDYDTGE